MNEDGEDAEGQDDIHRQFIADVPAGQARQQQHDDLGKEDAVFVVLRPQIMKGQFAMIRLIQERHQFPLVQKGTSTAYWTTTQIRKTSGTAPEFYRRGGKGKWREAEARIRPVRAGRRRAGFGNVRHGGILTTDGHGVKPRGGHAAIRGWNGFF